MTVDVNIRDDGEQAIAEVQAVFRVHNQDKQNDRKLTVALPGYPAPKPPPAQLSLTSGGDDIPVTAGFQQWWVGEAGTQTKPAPQHRSDLYGIAGQYAFCTLQLSHGTDSASVARPVKQRPSDFDLQRPPKPPVLAQTHTRRLQTYSRINHLVI